MKSASQVLLKAGLALGLFGVVQGLMMAGPAQAARSINACMKSGRSELQCRCDAAIALGTVSALKKFIVTYGRTNTACNAAASTLKIKVPPAPTPAAVAADKVKSNNGLGNGDEGNCSGSGCTDASNPGNGGTSGGGSTGGGGGGGGNGNGHTK